MSTIQLRDFCLVFVCHPGEIEIKAMLLAASVRQYHSASIELVAALPAPFQVTDLTEQTQLLLNILQVRTVSITNPVGSDYPIGNKLPCLGIHSEARKIIFLDSDILCLSSIPIDAFPAAICVKPADLASYSRNEADWEGIYKLFNLPLSQRRMLSTVSHQLMPPYFNAGVIAIDQGIDLHTLWIKCCKAIDQDDSIINKRPWLDQLGLPVAIARSGLSFHCLSELFNYPAHLKSVNDQQPVFCHYHWPDILHREPLLQSCVQRLSERYIALEVLLQAADNKVWQQLLPRHNASRHRLPPDRHACERSSDLVITGIPRSGTSLLCRQLHELPDCIIINEPTEIFEPLNNQEVPGWLATFYQTLRCQILAGEAIENKLINGKVIDDTNKLDQRTHYRPDVNRSDFVLGTKNTLAYLARLSCIKRAMPKVPVIACVRHPFDTIASWKNSFPHLQNVDFGLFPTGYCNADFLTGREQKRIAEIEATSSFALKRALLWCHLAEVIRDQADRLMIIRYEDLVKNSGAEVARILTALQVSDDCLPAYEPLKLSSHRDALDFADIDAITDICTSAGLYFNYQL